MVYSGVRIILMLLSISKCSCTTGLQPLILFARFVEVYNALQRSINLLIFQQHGSRSDNFQVVVRVVHSTLRRSGDMVLQENIVL